MMTRRRRHLDRRRPFPTPALSASPPLRHSATRVLWSCACPLGIASVRPRRYKVRAMRRRLLEVRGSRLEAREEGLDYRGPGTDEVSGFGRLQEIEYWTTSHGRDTSSLELERATFESTSHAPGHCADLAPPSQTLDKELAWLCREPRVPTSQRASS
ncbi:hypothetical protein BJ546DRAFT_639451 [Cryomyces antarcticus]